MADPPPDRRLAGKRGTLPVELDLGADHGHLRPVADRAIAQLGKVDSPEQGCGHGVLPTIRVLKITTMIGPAGGVCKPNFEAPFPARRTVALEPAMLLRLTRRTWFDLQVREPLVPRRIARFFLTLAERMGTETPDGTAIDLPLSRQEIAECVGTTVESAIRVMSKWNQDGLLVTERGRFVIPSLEKLAGEAEASGEGDS